MPGGGQVETTVTARQALGSVGTGLGVALSRTRGGGAAALTTGFRPSKGANNGVAVPGAPSPSSPARARPLSPKLLSI